MPLQSRGQDGDSVHESLTSTRMTSPSSDKINEKTKNKNKTKQNKTNKTQNKIKQKQNKTKSL